MFRNPTGIHLSSFSFFWAFFYSQYPDCLCNPPLPYLSPTRRTFLLLPIISSWFLLVNNICTPSHVELAWFRKAWPCAYLRVGHGSQAWTSRIFYSQTTVIGSRMGRWSAFKRRLLLWELIEEESLTLGSLSWQNINSEMLLAIHISLYESTITHVKTA